MWMKVMCLWGVCCGMTIAHGSDPEFLRDSFRVGRERITSGIFTVEVVHSVVDSDGVRERTDLIRCWFDFPQGRFRFERTDPKTFDGTNEENLRSWIGWIRAEEGQYLWQDRQLLCLDADSPYESIVGAHPFDVRLIGVLDLRGLVVPSPSLMTFPGPAEYFLKYENAELQKNSEVDAKNILSWKVNEPLDGFWIEVVTDRLNDLDCVPVSLDTYYIEAPEQKTTYSSVRTSWSAINGVRVPSTCDLLDRELSEEKYPEEVKMKFTWLAVNELIDSELFTPSAWELPYGTQTLRMVNGKVVVESVEGMLTDAEAAIAVDPELLETSSKRWVIFVLLGLNIVVTVVLVGWWIYRKRQLGQ